MITFDQALDYAMELPIEKRLSFVEILKKRTMDDIRSQIAEEADESRRAFHSDKLSVGTVEDLISTIEGEDI